MSSPTAPEAAGPGTAHPDGYVSYGPTAAVAARPTRLPPAPPESAGPAVESPGGEIIYGAASGYRSGPLPTRTAAEREAEHQLRAGLAASCACAAIPAVIIAQLAQLATDARRVVREGSGCPRCRAVPAQLISRLADALDAAHPHPRPRTRELEGAAR